VIRPKNKKGDNALYSAAIALKLANVQITNYAKLLHD
jgi:hypothetical protein